MSADCEGHDSDGVLKIIVLGQPSRRKGWMVMHLVRFYPVAIVVGEEPVVISAI